MSEIAAKSPLAVTGTKAVLLRSRDLTVDQGLDYIATWNSGMLLSDDLVEATAAQSQKRAPSFSKLWSCMPTPLQVWALFYLRRRRNSTLYFVIRMFSHLCISLWIPVIYFPCYIILKLPYLCEPKSGINLTASFKIFLFHCEIIPRLKDWCEELHFFPFFWACNKITLLWQNDSLEMQIVVFFLHGVNISTSASDK